MSSPLPSLCPASATEPLAYLNGAWVRGAEAVVSVCDSGFVLGITVTEQLRTFGGKLFRLDRHLDRLFRSLEIIDVDPGISRETLTKVARELAAYNHALLDSGDDLGLAMFVTPGIYPTMAASLSQRDHVPSSEDRQKKESDATVCLHTFPLPFASFAEKYRQGESLVVSEIPQVSAKCWPRDLKCRSRMHYYLADKQARRIAPHARAVLLDEDGFVTEATTASLITYFKEEGFVVPPHERILPGISMGMVVDLAEELRLPVIERNLRPEDLAQADEIMLTSTSMCILPVTQLNGQPIGNSSETSLYAQLLALWSKAVQVDIPKQAAQFAMRSVSASA